MSWPGTADVTPSSLVIEISTSGVSSVLLSVALSLAPLVSFTEAVAVADFREAEAWRCSRPTRNCDG
jgi:hypothetical protein